MSCVRIGGLEAFADDIRIPLKYGVDQCVGDTICAGGIMYGQRTIPAIARLLQGHPRGRRTRRAVPQLRQPDGDEHLGRRSTTAASRPSASATACSTAGARSPRSSASHRTPTCEYVCSGINHQTWYIDINAEGREIEPRRADRRLRGAPGLLAAGKGPHRRAEALRLLLDRIATATSPNTCPGTASARTRSTAGSTCPTGSTARPAATCATRPRRRNWFETDFPKFLEDAGKPLVRVRAHRRARQPHHRGAGDRAHLSRPLQRQQQGRHHQPARRLPSSRAPASSTASASTWSPASPCRGLRRHLLCLDHRPAHERRRRDDRRRRPAEARRAARPAGRRHLHPRRGLADGRRDARRPGAMAAAVRGRHRPPPSAACATPRSRPATGKAPPASRSARSRSCARRKPPRPPRPKASAPAASPDAAVPPTTGAGQAGHRAPLDRAVSAAASPAPARPARRPRQRQGQRPGQEATAAKRRKTLSIDSINVESQSLTTRYATHSAPEVDPGTSLAGCAAPAPPL